MRSHQVFARMTPEEAVAFFTRIKKDAPPVFTQAVHAASVALKMRPSFLAKQPFAKQVSAARRALSRVAASAIAEETLAIYFLEHRKELLVEWLDAAGVKHAEGALEQDEPPEPAAAVLKKAVASFRAAGEDPDRNLLLEAFAAQSSVEWPALEALIEP